jgi:hypothetical protein
LVVHRERSGQTIHINQDFILQEIEKLKRAKLICEMAHPTWIANLVVVPKVNSSGRLCVDSLVSTRLALRILTRS